MWRKDMSTMDAINSNEDKYMIKVSEDDAINAKFNTKLQELLDIAHSKKNVIEDTELIKHFTISRRLPLIWIPCRRSSISLKRTVWTYFR